MVQEREKQLLDYLYTVGQQVEDYMRRNWYNDNDTFYLGDITVTISPLGEKHDNVSVHVSTTSNREDWRTVRKEFDLRKGKSEYEESEWKV